MRKASCFASVISICAMALIICPSPASAQFGTEDENMKTEVDLAIARARGFKEYLRKKAETRELRQRAAEEQHEFRRLEDQKEENYRVMLVTEKAEHRVAEEQKADRLEANNDAEVARERARMELARRAYVIKRRHVQETIEREGYIDEMKEFNLDETRPGS